MPGTIHALALGLTLPDVRSTARPWLIPPLVLALVTNAACDEGDDVPRAPWPNIDGGLGLDGGGGQVPDTSCRDPDDLDCDGYAADAGDCDDRDPRRGPSALDVADNGIDEDCSGQDAPLDPSWCDFELKEDEPRADGVRRTLGLCGEKVTQISGRSGFLDVEWRRLDERDELADPRQVWFTQRFGNIRPREGARMLVLSTGVARDVHHEQYTPTCDVFEGQSQDAGVWNGGVAPPKGFPRDSSECENEIDTRGVLAYDDVGFRLRLRAPSNATALAFDSMFLTYEYPDFVCSNFNDFFVALLEGAPDEYENENIVVDAENNPIGVNSGLLSVCKQAREGRTGRPLTCTPSSEQLLLDTGYGSEEAECAPLRQGEEDLGGAATGWLQTEVPVRASQIVDLHIALWDSGDPLLDSTVLLDNFRFLTTPPQPGTRPAPPTAR
jgi:hypothetical protein